VELQQLVSYLIRLRRLSSDSFPKAFAAVCDGVDLSKFLVLRAGEDTPDALPAAAAAGDAPAAAVEEEEEEEEEEE